MHCQLSIKQKTRFINTPPIQTSVSDHHKPIGTKLRSAFTKGKPKKIFYRCHENFDNEKFEEELKKHLFLVLDFELFHLAFETTVDQWTPLEQTF